MLESLGTTDTICKKMYNNLKYIPYLFTKQHNHSIIQTHVVMRGHAHAIILNKPSLHSSRYFMTFIVYKGSKTSGIKLQGLNSKFITFKMFP